MAQQEDTELRDLVIEALEKNGSLAKIRALLRANIFLAFEDEYDNIKQNVSLDKITSVPEGILALSIVHDFLECCNLKNTLFVYMSESRQGKDYKYNGRKYLADKLNTTHTDMNEPVIVTLIKNAMKPLSRKYYDQGDTEIIGKLGNGNKNHKDEQNCTYIVHEDSTSTNTSQSNSYNSSDEKNKLHLRLQLDNSDTDTSTDSAREKSSSEYIPSEHIIQENDNNSKTHTEKNSLTPDDKNISHYFHEATITGNNNSSESTSYVDIKPFDPIEEKLMNTTGVPITENSDKSTGDSDKIEHNSDLHLRLTKLSVSDTSPSANISTASSATSKNNNPSHSRELSIRNTPKETGNSEENMDYSLDFTSTSSNHKGSQKDLSPGMEQDIVSNNPEKNISLQSPHQNSLSSQSSVSISDVAELIEQSEKSGLLRHEASQVTSSRSNKHEPNEIDKVSDDSGDFSESPVPSLSNLSLDVHSA